MTSPRFCSACGATLTEGARFCAACGAAVAPAAPSPAGGAGTPLENDVRDLLRKGQKIEAIKLVREHTGFDLRQAKERVEAIAAGMPPGSIPAHSDRGTCLGCLAMLVAGVALIVAGFAGLLRTSGAYRQALDMARADPRIVAALGEPIEASPFAMGRIQTGHGRWSVFASITLSGPKGKGTLRLRASTMRGYRDPRWDQYSVVEYYRDGEPYEIPLRARAAAN
jgi:hypothetical protein